MYPVSSTPKVAVLGLPGRWSTDALSQALSAHFGEVPALALSDAILDLSDGSVRCGGIDLAQCQGVVVKKVASDYRPEVRSRIEILRWLEYRGVRVFSPAESLSLLIDRLAGTRVLRQAGIDMPETCVTADAERAVSIVEAFGAAVLKPLYTSKGRGMRVLTAGQQNLREELAAFRGEGHEIYYLQRKLQLPGRDLGLVFVGGQYLTCYARVAGSEAWNTTTTSGGHYEAHQPSAEVIELATRAQATLPMDFTCVDVAETSEGPKVFEVSAFGGFRGTKEACGVDSAAAYAQHVAKVLGVVHA